VEKEKKESQKKMVRLTQPAGPTTLTGINKKKKKKQSGHRKRRDIPQENEGKDD